MLNNEYTRNRVCLTLIWAVTGALSLGLYPLDQSVLLLGDLPVSQEIGRMLVFSGGLLDIVMALGVMLRPCRQLWHLQLVIIITYTVLVTVLVPEYWLHPFGPILKNLAVVCVLLNLLDHDKRIVE